MLVDFSQAAKSTATTERDEVIRSTIQSVFNYMGLGLIITALVSYFSAQSPELMQQIHGTGLRWVVFFAPFGFVIYMNAKFKTATAGQLKTAFWGFCALMGLSLSYICLAYTGEAIFRAFAVSACMFLSMSLYGYATKRDLTSMGSFMFMGLIGILVTGLINTFFLKSAPLDYVISLIGVAVFMGLTAWDVQKIKRSAVFMSANAEEGGKLGIMHALSLYLDFINLFLFILRIQNR